MSKVITKDDVGALFGKLEDQYDVYAPVEQDGLIFYRNDDENVFLNFSNSRKPPKGVFFPQTEKMMEFELEGPRIVGVKDFAPDGRPIVVFGVRPCDARALQVLDALFSWDYVDPYFLRRRESAVTIALGCVLPDMPAESCFCTSVGGSPSSTDGTDMLWTDIGEKFLVESLTDKGNAILEVGRGLFTDAAQDEVEAAEEAKAKAAEAIARSLDAEGIPDALESTFDHDYWNEFAKRCLGCGICTLLCPTCHCFDINDVRLGGQAWRERTWDSCQYPYYTIHASGHNPRPEKKHRQRNRVYHKFLYSAKNLDMLGCVGCGRCIANCPVNIDIIQVVDGAKEAGR